MTRLCHRDEPVKKQSICPQVPSHFVIRDSSPKHKDLTCNERSECELRMAKLCHCDELMKKQSICPQVPSCFAIRDSSPKHKDLTCNERSECESRMNKTKKGGLYEKS